MVHARLPLGLDQTRVQLVVSQLPGVGKLKELLLGKHILSHPTSDQETGCRELPDINV